MAYYVGDPCYVIPDEDWGKFFVRGYSLIPNLTETVILMEKSNGEGKP